MIHLRRFISLLVLPFAIALSLTESAQAGTYKVHGCRLPSGAVAPANGWVASYVGSWTAADNMCASGGGLSVQLSPQVAHGFSDQARWELTAPANTRIVAFAGNRASRVGAGQPYGSPGVLLHAERFPLEGCTQFDGCSGRGSLAGWNAPGNAFSFGGLDASIVGIVSDCGGGPGGVCPAEDPKATGALFRSEITFSDTLDPQPSNVSGGLVQQASHRGTEWVTFNTADQGAGVYRGLIEIDGTAVVDEVLDVNAGKCVDARPNEGDAYEFFDKQPCKLSASASLKLDTTRLSDGAHTIRVRVIDAAGNSGTAYGPSPFEVRNHTGSASTITPTGGSLGNGPGSTPSAATSGDIQSTTHGSSNGAGSSDPMVLTASFARNGRRVLTIGYGKRVVVRGRLATQSGRPIAGALISLVGRKAAWTVSTAPDGRFSLTLPRRVSSHALRLTYLTQASAAAVTSAVSLRLKVRAGLRLSISPRKVRNRRAITFRGRLLGAPIPRGGKLIELQVRFPSGWRTFATVRTTRRGTFRYRYRFMRTFDPITYKFRVRSRGDGSYPYVTGSSRAVSVRVR